MRKLDPFIDDLEEAEGNLQPLAILSKTLRNRHLNAVEVHRYSSVRCDEWVFALNYSLVNSISLWTVKQFNLYNTCDWSKT